jgi:hypothetical protein
MRGSIVVRWTLAAVIATLASAGAGCTHAPEFRRVDGPTRLVASPGRVEARVTLVRDADCLAEGMDEPLVAAGASLVASGADYVMRVRCESQGQPSWLSLPIAWPGFIVFAPAWHGLVWRYELVLSASIREPGGRELPAVQVRQAYDVRHTSDMYGLLIGSGWFILYSAPALGAGLAASMTEPDLGALGAAFPEAERRALGRELGVAAAAPNHADPNPKARRGAR